ncbi:hypothetical protein BDW71DRAFT_211179 [Aspergillus fruticulosus]
MDPFGRLPWFALHNILSALPDLPTLHSLHNASPDVAAFLQGNNDLFAQIVDSIMESTASERGLTPIVQRAVRYLVTIWAAQSKRERQQQDPDQNILNNLRNLAEQYSNHPTPILAQLLTKTAIRRIPSPNLKAGNAFVQNMENALQTPSPIAAQHGKETVSPFRVPDDDDDDTDEAESRSEQPGQNPSRQQGDLSIYAYYASASGRIQSLCAWAVWLDIWTSANAEHPNSRIGMYLGVYVFLGIASIAFAIAVSWLLMVNIVSSSALELHERVEQYIPGANPFFPPG